MNSQNFLEAKNLQKEKKYEQCVNKSMFVIKNSSRYLPIYAEAETLLNQCLQSVLNPQGFDLAQGIDVSGVAGKVDWKIFKRNGITFAFAKATEGITIVDRDFPTNWAGMKEAGIIRGAYHMFRLRSDQYNRHANSSIL
jgi:lysozyme